MLVNLTDMFSSEHKVEQKELVLDMDAVTIGGVSYDILTKEPVVLNLKNISKGKALVQATTSFTMELACDRCLKPVKYSMKIVAEEEVISPDYVEETSEDSEQDIFMDGYQLKVDDLIYRDIVLNWPMKILCREDCKGICRICGKDLNTGECGCDTFVPSPGLAGIKEIFNANKEV